MQFVHPEILYGLFLLSIPVVIHLFKLRRYKTVYFSTIKFLEAAQTSHKSRARLRDLLLLLIRLLFIICLVLAFAQPFSKSQTGILSGFFKPIAIYIDPSPSMKNQGINGDLLNQAKSQALELVKRFPLETRFLFLDESRAGSFSRFLDRYEITERIQSLDFSTRSSKLKSILLQLKEEGTKSLADTDLKSKLFVFSDFQQSFMDPDAVPDSLQWDLILEPVKPQNTSNIFIDSLWLGMPMHHFGTRILLNGKIKNTGNQAYPQFPVSLKINDSLVAQTTVSIQAASSASFTIGYLPVTDGQQQGELLINDYPVDFDNSFYFAFGLNPSVSVCQLYETEENSYISAVFDQDSLFHYTAFKLSNFPDPDFSNFETLILCNIREFKTTTIQQLQAYINRGGNVILFPPDNGNQQEMNLLGQNIGGPSLLEILLRPEPVRFTASLDDFLSEITLNAGEQLAWPSFSKYFRISGYGSQTRPLLQTLAGRPVLTQTKYGNGTFTLAAFSLNDSYSDFQEHPLFIPLFYYLATTDSRAPMLFARTGSTQAYPIRNSPPELGPIQLFQEGSIFNTIPQQEQDPVEPLISIYLNEWEGPSGFLQAGWPEGWKESIAINYDQQESQMDFYSESDLNEFIQNFGKDAVSLHNYTNNILFNDDSNNRNSRSSESTILLFASLLLVFFESIIHRMKS